MVSALDALQIQVAEVKAKNLSLIALSQEFMQNALLKLHENAGRKLDGLSATVLTDVLGKFLEIDQRLAFWLAREVRQLPILNFKKRNVFGPLEHEVYQPL